jgi:NADH-quinone oxidoreductase subunit N
MSATVTVAERIASLVPEMIVFGGSVVVSVTGLSPRRSVRAATPFLSVLTLIAALVALTKGWGGSTTAGLLMPGVGPFARGLILLMGVGGAALAAGLVDRRYEEAIARGVTPFDPIRVVRGEFFAFMLLSICGAMLIPGSPDLIWLFLALELTSLPTYIMVAMSRGTRRAQEAAVKYFFLGALSTAIMVYGFALLYGSTGSLQLTEIRAALAQQAAMGGIDSVGTIGLLLVTIALCFKLAAAPMHFYAPDVYEGAAAPVTGFLSFLPKMAGFSALLLVVDAAGWGSMANGGNGLPPALQATLWMVTVLTMTLGNVGALLQRSAKRMLAYSSIAHSGYMLMAIVAGPELGLPALLFYLLAYGVTNNAIFGALSGVERNGQEVEQVEDLAGLARRHPGAATWLAVGSASLMGMPPFLGFWAKLVLFIAVVKSGHTPLVVIAAVNSVVSVWYYLRLAGVPILSPSGAAAEGVVKTPNSWPRLAAIVFGVGVVALPLFMNRLVAVTEAAAGAPRASAQALATPATPASQAASR